MNTGSVDIAEKKHWRRHAKNLVFQVQRLHLSKMKMSLIRGSPQGCFHFLYLAGQMRYCVM